MEKIRIGLVGQAGTGKTSLAKHWVGKYGFARLSFAQAVKEVVAVLRLDPNRDHHQRIGDGIRQLIGPDIWIHVVEERMKAWAGNRLVIDDVRYPNEVSWLKSRGFFILALDRPERDRLRDRPEMKDPKLRSHPSELLFQNLEVADIDLHLYAEDLPGLFHSADKWLDNKLHSNPMLQSEKVATKDEVMDWIRIIVQQQLAIIQAPIDPNLEGQPLMVAKNEKQKAARIIIQAIKAISSPGVGLKVGQVQTIIDLMKQNAAGVEAK